jgi:hypothetical protein
MSNQEVIIQYKKLLDIGIKRIKGTEENDLEEHAELDKLLPLNEYVYTHYSTNREDDTYSIEFVILADYMDIILEELDKKGMWYCAKNYKTNEYKMKYDADLNDVTQKKYINIRKNDLGRFRPKTEQNPYGWEIVNINEKENIVTIVRDNKIHFLESDTIEEFKKMYNDSNYFLEMSFIPEMREIIDIDLLSKNIAIITVEDPEINRNTLYDELLKIFQEKLYFTPLNSSTKLPVTILNDAPLERPIINLHGYKRISAKKGGRRKRLGKRKTTKSRKLNKKISKKNRK